MICCAIGILITMIISLAAYVVGIIAASGKLFDGGGEISLPLQLQRDVDRKYKRFKKPLKKVPFNSYCYPKSFNVQPQQAFAGEYMKPGSGHKELLVYHKIGAGKTCLSIQVGEQWVSVGKPIMVMPASLIPGYRAELRSPCAGTKYISEEERAALREAEPGSKRYNEIMKLSDKRIDNAYHIYSYNKFAADMVNGKVPTAPLIIIDEIQNVDNEHGVFFKHLRDWIVKHRKASVVVMSGTPIFDSPDELINIARLLRIDVPDELTPEDIPRLFAGKVSYYEGAPSYTFPEAYVKVVKCPMSTFQAKWYRSEIAIERSKHRDIERTVPNNFYMKSRQRSNVVFPNGTTGASGLTELTPAIIKSSLETYSCKYAAMMRRLRKGKLSFIYSSFTGPYGISSVKKVLVANGYVDFAIHGPGPKRFAVFSGEETLKEKDRIRAIFNSAENDDGGRLQLIIGSPAIKEGVSLMRIRQVHVLELYWNHSRLAQIFGRAVRYCSHKSLPRDERNVNIYLYAAVDKRKRGTKRKRSDGSNEYTPEESIDMYMLKIADDKREQAEPYIAALINCAVDKLIHYPSTATVE